MFCIPLSAAIPSELGMLLYNYLKFCAASTDIMFGHFGILISQHNVKYHALQHPELKLGTPGFVPNHLSPNLLWHDFFFIFVTSLKNYVEKISDIN